MEHDEQPSAQAGDQTQEQSGIQKRINELVAQSRQAEERAAQIQAESQRQIAEMAAKMAEQSLLLQRQASPSPAAQVDPLDALSETVDPNALKAIKAAFAMRDQQHQAQLAQFQRNSAIETAQYAIQAGLQGVQGIPAEVAKEAQNLYVGWKANGLPYTPDDAINFALGAFNRKQLARAAPVAGYNPAQQPSLPVTPGGYVAPPQPRSALPANFDQLSPTQQLDLLDKLGVGDLPLT